MLQPKENSNIYPQYMAQVLKLLLRPLPIGGNINMPTSRVNPSTSRYLRTQSNQVSQSEGSHVLKCSLLYCLFFSKWDLDLLNEQHAVLKKTLNKPND